MQPWSRPVPTGEHHAGDRHQGARRRPGAGQVAFVPGDGQVIEPTRWYILPPAAAGEIEVRVIAIGVDEEHYDVLVRGGWEAFFSTMLSRLRDVGQEPLN